jgi:hypothetical protein
VNRGGPDIIDVTTSTEMSAFMTAALSIKNDSELNEVVNVQESISVIITDENGESKEINL